MTLEGGNFCCPSLYETLPLILQNVKINHKHDLLVRGLSDLINQPSPSSSHHSVDNSRMVVQEKVNDRSVQSFESKLTGTACILTQELMKLYYFYNQS